MHKCLSILIISFAFVANAFAKYGIPSTEGTEFFVTYMLNYGSTENTDSLSLQLIFSAKQTTNITISNPQTGWNDVHTIPANQVTTITLPKNQCYASKAEQIEKRGLYIKASAPISAYASNFHPYSYDATILFPWEALGKKYIIQTYENIRWRKEFIVVATENNTTIQIKPHANTTKGSRKNIWKTILLNRGETYFVMSLDSHNDLSGSEIVADKPIAVFSGHECADIPVGNNWCDHIVEQQTPVNMWGKRFAVTRGALAKSNSIIITASENNTIIKQNGSKVATINKDDSYEFRLNDNSAFIETSSPSTCFLYMEGAKENKIGDPSSVQINPIEQSLSDITFATFQRNVSRMHYINVITTKEGAAGAKLNGMDINGKFKKLTGNNSLYYAQIRINHGVHRLTTTKDGFSGYVYGIGYCESYAYSIGSATMDLEAGILVDSIPHENKVYDDNRCYLNSILFSPNISVEYDNIHWDFGDGSTSNFSEVSHTYSIPGTYTIQMIATKGIAADTAYTTLVLNDIYTDTIYANICELDTYEFYGTNYSESGIYTKSFSKQNDCDSVITLVLTVHQPFLAQENAEIKRGTSFQWHNKWYRDPGVYYDSLKSVYGCDSVYELTLEPIASDLVMYDTICWQAEYEFHGITYSLPPISGNEPSDYIDYTLEYRDKDNCVAYVMNLAINNMSDDAYTITDTISEGDEYYWLGDSYTESGIYTKTTSRGYGCAQREYTLDLTVLPFPIYKIEDTLCIGDTIHFRDKIYSKAGVYLDTLITPIGIEAIYQLTLHDSRTTEKIYVSNVASYDFNGEICTESGTYYDTISNAVGCDSIIILYLGINEKCTITEEEYMTICEGESITWNDIVCDAEQSYQKAFTSSAGCDSICILHLSFTSHKETVITDSICEGEYYRLDSQKLISTGIYTHTFTASNGCDSIVTLNLIVLRPTDSVDNVVICDGEVYTWHGNTYSAPIDTTEILINSLGCDSICTLHLNVNPKLSGDTSATFCKGHPFQWHGVEYSNTGDYQRTYTSRVTGCDSIVTLHLTQLEPTDSIEIVTICAGASHIWHGQTFTSSITTTETITNAAGCDSVCTLQLTVLPALTGDTSATFCKGHPFKWHGTPYTNGGDYPYTYTSKATGCDSIVTLHLSQLEPSDSIEDATICEGETHIWHGNPYTSTTDITEIITNAAGCDSVCTLHLKVNPKLSGDTTASVCDGGTFTWWENTYSTKGDYARTFQSQVTGCDSIVTLHLNILPPLATTLNESITEGATFIWNGLTYSEKGTYTQNFTTSEGCDSIVTLHLTVNPLVYDILAHIQCADDPFIEFDVTASEGLFHQLQFIFTPKAIAQHFRDTIVDYSASQILIPNSARAGMYDVAVSPIFNSQVLDTRDIHFTLLYPSSVLDQHWDDFIGVLTHNYNGGYDFVGFQWYKNGQPMAGENHSYTYQPLEMGSAYSAMLEEPDGTKLMTCEIIATPQTEISLYPTLLQPHQIIRLYSLEPVIIWIYDTLGRMIYTNAFEKGDNQFDAPQNQGMYIIKIQQTGKQEKTSTKKIIVR